MNIWNSYICTADIHFKQMKDHRSNVPNFSVWEKQAWKKIKAWTGIEPTGNQANWELVNGEFVIYPWMEKILNEYIKDCTPIVTVVLNRNVADINSHIPVIAPKLEGLNGALAFTVNG